MLLPPTHIPNRREDRSGSPLARFHRAGIDMNAARTDGVRDPGLLMTLLSKSTGKIPIILTRSLTERFGILFRGGASVQGSGLTSLGQEFPRPVPVFRFRISRDAFGPGSPLQLPLADAPGNSAAIPIASGRWRSLRAPLAPGAAGLVHVNRVPAVTTDRAGSCAASYTGSANGPKSDAGKSDGLYSSFCDSRSWQIRACARQPAATTGLLAA